MTITYSIKTIRYEDHESGYLRPEQCTNVDQYCFRDLQHSELLEKLTIIGQLYDTRSHIFVYITSTNHYEDHYEDDPSKNYDYAYAHCNSLDQLLEIIDFIQKVPHIF